MAILILGLVIFLGAHTLTTLRETRAGLIARFGENGYKGLYSLASAVGLVLIVYGFGSYRAAGYIPVWDPPTWTRHLAMPLVWLAFIALISTYAPPGKIKGWLHHPMLAAVKIWALAHLLANGDLGGIILFGSLLAWAVWDRIAVKRRGDFGAPASASFTKGDAIAVIVGTIAAVAMVYLHPILIGVSIV
ncbi:MULTISPECIES: NnrU family protein [unclassified Beijerinckia]|uniref:NnrU family protein n=1 Tax=unclassified Beijerinckia TaxID=2638183 RepID=UPI00089571DF|nr:MULTISPECIES: NnrU family protein [unclassified Beijerinckia]MDH7794781.1 putative membrane protein [Beijerinckia sp. GAS462]SEB74941.1 NnrU protein [Beijerinckia sp. 28-YEA-48]